MQDEVKRPYMADLNVELEHYCAQLRRSDWPKLEMSGLYDLYPSSDDTACEYHWPDDWPFVDSPGVYFVFDADMQVLYIGKASLNSWFGNRLSTYFRYGDHKECVVQNSDSWKGVPRFVAVIPIEAEYKFEAPALEEYLITKLKPIITKQRTSTDFLHRLCKKTIFCRRLWMS